MKGRDWIKCLTRAEEDNFLCNLREFKSDNDIENFLDEEYDGFYNFIGCAFSWSGTPEGYDVWRMIAYRNVVVPSNRYRMDRFKFV